MVFYPDKIPVGMELTSELQHVQLGDLAENSLTLGRGVRERLGSIFSPLPGRLPHKSS